MELLGGADECLLKCPAPFWLALVNSYHLLAKSCILSAYPTQCPGQESRSDPELSPHLGQESFPTACVQDFFGWKEEIAEVKGLTLHIFM